MSLHTSCLLTNVQAQASPKARGGDPNNEQSYTRSNSKQYDYVTVVERCVELFQSHIAGAGEAQSPPRYPAISTCTFLYTNACSARKLQAMVFISCSQCITQTRKHTNKFGRITRWVFPFWLPPRKKIYQVPLAFRVGELDARVCVPERKGPGVRVVGRVTDAVRVLVTVLLRVRAIDGVDETGGEAVCVRVIAAVTVRVGVPILVVDELKL